MVLSRDHFEGGANLTNGQRKRTGAILVELLAQGLVSAASVGGLATESVAAVGLLAVDTILMVAQKTPGAGAGKVLIGWAAQVDGQLDLTWDADPGAGAVVQILVLRPGS